MSMYGANPEQLTHLGSTLNRQIEAITSVMGSVDGVLGGADGVMGQARALRRGVERVVQAGLEQAQRGLRHGRTRLHRPLRRVAARDGRRLTSARRIDRRRGDGRRARIL